MSKHTPGPWRWEFNRDHKVLHLVGGRPQYDLTIMDFARWGMGGAVATLRDTAEDGMNIMHRLCDRPDWIAPFPGRAHHADWCADVTHPDMRLIASAPDLLEALQGLLDDIDGLMSESVGVAGLHLNGDVAPWSELDEGGRFERLSGLSAARAAIAKATGGTK